MLKLAYPYKQQLEQKFIETMFVDKFKYYYCSSYHDYELNLANSSWNDLDFVSVDKNDNVIGFLSAKIHRGDEMVSSLRVINFYDLNYTFSKDFHQFLNDLFVKFKFRKVSFSVVVGNPAEKMYDKYIEKYSGRVVGVKKKDIKLYDGEYYDFKMYEIFRDDYVNKKRGKNPSYSN